MLIDSLCVRFFSLFSCFHHITTHSSLSVLHTARGIPWMRAKAWSQERIDDVATLARRIFDQFYKGQVEQRSSPVGSDTMRPVCA